MAVTCRKYQEKGLTIMGYVKWSYDTLTLFCGDVFKAFGFSEEEGSIIEDVLLPAALCRQKGRSPLRFLPVSYEWKGF